MRLLRLTFRFLHIAWVVFVASVVYGLRRLGLLFRGGDREARERLRGEVLADTFQKLGATYVKFGQILSTRPDLFGPGITEALAHLQDQVPPFPFSTGLSSQATRHTGALIEPFNTLYW